MGRGADSTKKVSDEDLQKVYTLQELKNRRDELTEILEAIKSEIKSREEQDAKAYLPL